MTKAGLIKTVADVTGETQKKVKEFIEIYEKTIVDGLVADGEVKTGLGTIKVADRAERMGRNPSTGEPIPIPAKKAPKMVFAKTVKDAVK